MPPETAPPSEPDPVTVTAAILAWCDHIESRATPNKRSGDPRVNAYADGFRDGVLETLAQVRQAVLHGFDVAALDGKALT